MMATPPRQLAGDALHAEALRSIRHYPDPGAPAEWGNQPARDYPYGERPAAGAAAFRPEDVEHFCREGYVVLRGWYGADELASLRESTFEVLARLGEERQGEKGSADMFYGDVAFAPLDGPSDAANPHRVGYINDIHTFQPSLLPTLAHARLLSGLTELLGPDIDAWQVATVVKSPELRWCGGGYSWHQDVADYGGSGDAQGSGTTFTYHGMRNFGNLCAITYLQDCAPDQGATSVIPRSHRQPDGREGPIRRPLFTEGSTEGVWNGLYRTVEGIDEVEARAVTPTVSAGDVLIFDSWLIHRANINTTLESKIGLINVYCRPDCLPAVGPRADGTGTLGLALLRGGEPVAFEPPAEGEGQGGRGWGDADRRGGARL